MAMSQVNTFMVKRIIKRLTTIKFNETNAEYIKECYDEDDDFEEFYDNNLVDILQQELYTLFLEEEEGSLTEEEIKALTDTDKLIVLQRVFEHQELAKDIRFKLYKDGVIDGIIDWDKVYRFYMYITAHYLNGEDKRLRKFIKKFIKWV
jgi:hypothetical protein